MLGCLKNRRDFDSTNANSTLATVLTSVGLFRIRSIPEGRALGSVYGPDGYANSDKPNDVRTVNAAFTPEYFADELQLQAHDRRQLGELHEYLHSRPAALLHRGRREILKALT